ncbi:MAG: HxsD-like protein [Nanoarchaeota archaeon]|nr:HxsD-like protein [Nanoarchaeota archaeon]
MLKLNKNIYSEQAIKQTIEDFKGVCHCKFIERLSFFEISIESKEKNADKEFANYVLALMK